MPAPATWLLNARLVSASAKPSVMATSTSSDTGASLRLRRKSRPSATAPRVTAPTPPNPPAASSQLTDAVALEGSSAIEVGCSTAVWAGVGDASRVAVSVAVVLIPATCSAGGAGGAGSQPGAEPAARGAAPAAALARLGEDR